MRRHLAAGLMLSFLLLGCGTSHKLMLDEVGMLHAQNENLKKQADTYAQLIAENQLALGKLIEEHHILADQMLTETCKPRVF